MIEHIEFSPAALNDYANDATRKFFDNLLSDEQKKWAWHFIQLVKHYFPDADHYTLRVTGNNPYISIGQKTKTISRGYPFFDLYFRNDQPNVWVNSRRIEDSVLGKKNRNARFGSKTLEEMDNWFSKVMKALEKKNLIIEGEGLVPKDYKNLVIQNEDDDVPELNKILYGPPGTGKTYATIDEALKILVPVFFEEFKAERAELKKRFDELMANKQIRFVTFHQSFSYEDFVEGIRANSDEGHLEYEVEDGVFKTICIDAVRKRQTEQKLQINTNPRVWKISIDGTGMSPTKKYCLDNNEARIGWGGTGNLKLDLKNNAYYQNLGSGDKGTLSYFADEIAIGDIIICIHSSEMINAVGVVTGEYRFDNQVPVDVINDYNHVLPVKWLYRDLQLNLMQINNNKTFVQKTVYRIKHFTWGDLNNYLTQKQCSPIEANVFTEDKKPYVLIIDEINRGNISRIFGELITLIEPSKRAGANEALEVILPYSKKPFSVPDNVYLIGTMNTADRSLAGLDIALRRRFSFIEMPPKPELLKGVFVEGIDIEKLLTVMNQRIEALLDCDHCLGHAYFLELKDHGSIEKLAFIFKQKILPLLQEYFFEDWERICWVLNDHRKVNQKYQFVKKSVLSSKDLFGDEIASQIQDKAWTLNESAFDCIESYKEIIKIKEVKP